MGIFIMIVLIDNSILILFVASKSRRSKARDRKLYVYNMMSGELVVQKEPYHSKDRKGILEP